MITPTPDADRDPDAAWQDGYDLGVEHGKTLAEGPSPWRWALLGGGVVAVVAAVAIAAVAVIGSDDSPPASAPAAAVSEGSPTSVAPSTTASRPALAQVGQRVQNGGVAITINSVSATTSISYQVEGYRGQFSPENARPGGQFVSVRATVENVGQISMDLTCGYPIGNKLIDSNDRQFDTYDSLYRVEGNPGCNDNLQPGFSSEMTWVYELPLTSTPTMFGFYDSETQSVSNVKFIDLGSVPPAK
jgi:hypothetical protein